MAKIARNPQVADVIFPSKFQKNHDHYRIYITQKKFHGLHRIDKETPVPRRIYASAYTGEIKMRHLIWEYPVGTILSLVNARTSLIHACLLHSVDGTVMVYL